MLRGNLATRPFYNERLVTLGLLLIAVMGVGLAVYNASRLLTLSSQRADLRARIARDVEQAGRIDAETHTVQKSVSANQLGGLAASATEANALIDQRTFSWSAFFDVISKTLPIDARLVAVAPKLDKGNVVVSMSVVSRSADDLASLVKSLTDTGVFYDVSPNSSSTNDDGTITSIVQAGYLAPKAAAAAKKGHQ